MGDLTLEQVHADLRKSDRSAYLEQRIFVLSPFGTFTTAALLFVIVAGSLLLIASAEGLSLLVETPDGTTLDARLRVGLVLSLMVTTVLGMQRHVRVRERAELATAAAIYRGGLSTARRLAALTPPEHRLAAASLAGLMLGGLLSWLVFGRDPDFTPYPLLLAWFAAIITLLTMSFMRGIELTRQGSRISSALVQNDLIIDLLRIDRLTFLGRSAGRFALIWFSIGAVSCLFFVSNGITKFTVSLIAVMLLIGGSTFFGMMERIHRRIHAAKHEELERVRTQIDAVRTAAAKDADAAQRLQGLLAYETRIAAAPEWPFDQTTLVRVCASALILTLPWFGQAIAAYLIEHLGSR